VWDGAFERVRRKDYEILSVPDAGEDLDQVCNVDMWVIFADGEIGPQPLPGPGHDEGPASR